MGLSRATIDRRDHERLAHVEDYTFPLRLLRHGMRNLPQVVPALVA